MRESRYVIYTITGMRINPKWMLLDKGVRAIPAISHNENAPKPTTKNGEAQMNGIFKDTMANMNWRDIQHSVDKNALVLLPLGVIEEHGSQLCLGTDTYTAHLYCLAVKEKLEEKGNPVVIAPPFYWGVCQSTGGFIGSFTARKETVIAMVFDIIASLAGFGYQNIFGVNAHGDIDHNIAMISAFKDANEQLRVNARCRI